jgi:type IV secretory pathway VirB10-like protein
MRNCPVCGESFGDELNFCDVDGTPLARDPAEAAQARNKFWSILGVVLVLGALAISALSIIFLPKGRVASPVQVSSVPQPAPTPEGNPVPPEAANTSEVSSIPSEPESLVAPDVAPELKKKDPAPGRENANITRSAKEAATEDAENSAPSSETKAPEPETAKPEAPLVRTANETPETETPRVAGPPPTDPKNTSKGADNSNSKKKADDKDKKKGGFFKVFKKIFGKG